VIVPRDLTRGFDEEIEEAALRIISLHLGLVMDSSGILQKWEALTLNAAPRDHSAI
jgi:hypothetical protein